MRTIGLQDLTPIFQILSKFAGFERMTFEFKGPGVMTMPPLILGKWKSWRKGNGKREIAKVEPLCAMGGRMSNQFDSSPVDMGQNRDLPLAARILAVFFGVLFFAFFNGIFWLSADVIRDNLILDFFVVMFSVALSAFYGRAVIILVFSMVTANHIFMVLYILVFARSLADLYSAAYPVFNMLHHIIIFLISNMISKKFFRSVF